MIYPKVIIGCPIHESKDYCIRQWLKYVCTELTYPGYAYEVFLVDNSPNKQWHKKLLREVGGLYPNLTIIHYQPTKFFIPKGHKKPVPTNYTTAEIIAQCQNKIITYCKKKKADYFCSIECDNFSVRNVIERLQAHNKLVVGAYYQTYVGYVRTPLLQVIGNQHMQNCITMHPRLLTYKEIVARFKPGAQAIHGIGMGCELINMEVFEKADRYGNKIFYHSDQSGKGLSDSHWHTDLMQLDIEVNVDVTIPCGHWNDSWTYKNTVEALAGIG